MPKKTERVLRESAIACRKEPANRAATDETSRTTRKSVCSSAKSEVAANERGRKNSKKKHYERGVFFVCVSFFCLGFLFLHTCGELDSRGRLSL
jgi:hypothetical protein